MTIWGGEGIYMSAPGKATIEGEARAAAQESRATPLEAAAAVADGMDFKDALEAVALKGVYFSPISTNNPVPWGPAFLADARAACHRKARSFLAAHAISLALEADPATPAVRTWLQTYAGLGAAPERSEVRVP